MAKRDVILAKIKEGGATRESLMRDAEVNEKGLASQLTYIRMMGNYPVVGEDGTYTLTTADAWEARKASTGVGGKTLSPADRLQKAEARSKRAASAYDNAKTKKEANPDDRLAELGFVKAEAEFEITEILLGKAQADYDALPEDEKEATTASVDEADEADKEDIDESEADEADEEDIDESEVDDFEEDFE